MQCATSPEAERKTCEAFLQLSFSQLAAEMLMMFATTTELLPGCVHFCTQTGVASGPLQLLTTFSKFLKEILASGTAPLQLLTLTYSEEMREGLRKGQIQHSLLAMGSPTLSRGE